MSGTTEVPQFPDTKPGGSGVPPHVWDPEVAKRAGLTPFDELKERFGTNYQAALEYAKSLKKDVSKADLNILRLKAEYGGMIRFLRFVAPHGTKTDLYAEINLDRSTAKRWELLADFFGWAYLKIVAEVTLAESQGKDTSAILTIDHVIAVGMAEAAALGATKKERRKGYFKGEGQVLMFDPYAKTVGMVDVPAGFPGTKSGAHWVQRDVDGGHFQLWVEQKTGKTASYYEITDLPYIGGTLNLGLRERAIFARADKKKNLMEFTVKDTISDHVHFDAREPKQTEVLAIDPAQGQITSFSLIGNSVVASDDYKVTAIDLPLLSGLVVLETDPADLYKFKIGEQDFRGRSFIARLDEDRWIAPLKLPMSVGDLKQHLAWTTLQAALDANNEKMRVNEFEGYEAIDNEDRIQVLFGVSKDDLNMIHKNSLTDNERSLAGPYLKIKDGKRVYHVEKMRELVNRVKAEWAQANAEGFVEATAEDMGAKNWGEHHDLVRIGLGLDRHADTMKAQQEGGYLRIIAQKRLYHLERMKQLVQGARNVLEADGETIKEALEGIEQEKIDQETDDQTEQTWSDHEQTDPETVQETEQEDEDDPVVVYAAMGYADRELADRKLIDDLNGRLDSIVRKVISFRSQIEGDWAEWIADDLKAIQTTAETAKPLVAELADHLDVLKSENASSISPDELAALYVDTDTETGQEIPMPPLPATITRAYLRTSQGDITIFNRSGDYRSTAVH